MPLLATTSDLRARLLLARASKDPTSAQRILREASAAARPEELRRIAATALATDSPSTAVEIYARALAADPADPISRVGEAIALSRAGDPAAKKIMEGASEDTELSPTLQLRLASEWLRRGDPASCLPLTMRATEKMPSATAHREAGRALLALGRTSESIAQLREAIGFDAGDALTHLTLAEALIHMGDTGAARPHLVRATLLDPRVITRSRAIELAGNLDP